MKSPVLPLRNDRARRPRPGRRGEAAELFVPSWRLRRVKTRHTSRFSTMLELAARFYHEPRTFKKAIRAGFHGERVLTNATVLANWESVATMARQYPLEYAIHFPTNGELTPGLLDGAVSLYCELACREMVIQPRMCGLYARRLSAREPSLCLAVENGTLGRAGFDRWATEGRWLTLNVKHLSRHTLQDAPLEAFLATVDAFLAVHGGKLRLVHLPGYKDDGDGHRPMCYGPQMVSRLLTRLARAGFSGLVLSEVGSRHQTYCGLWMEVLLFAGWRLLAAHARPPIS